MKIALVIIVGVILTFAVILVKEGKVSADFINKINHTISLCKVSLGEDYRTTLSPENNRKMARRVADRRVECRKRNQGETRSERKICAQLQFYCDEWYP